MKNEDLTKGMSWNLSESYQEPVGSVSSFPTGSTGGEEIESVLIESDVCQSLYSYFGRGPPFPNVACGLFPRRTRETSH